MKPSIRHFRAGTLDSVGLLDCTARESPCDGACPVAPKAGTNQLSTVSKSGEATMENLCHSS